MLVILPFEEEFYRNHQVKAQYVGHPLMETLDSHIMDNEHRALKRAQFSIRKNDLCLGIMPGSRKKEVDLHLPLQLKVASQLREEFPGLKVALLVAPSLERDFFKPYLENYGESILIVKDEPFEMIQLTDYILATSGTATLMVGLMGVPFVTMYRMNFITSLIAKWVVKGVQFFGLVNLILDEEVSPERFQEKANQEELVKLLRRMMTDKTYQDNIQSKLQTLRNVLGAKKATPQVAKVVQEYIQ